MPRRLPPLNALRAFEAAGRHASFSRAAEELHVSHAAVSRHVRGLEQRLGVQLFKVVSRGVELTQTGARYLAEISPALDAIALATEDLTPDPDGQITVSCESNFAVKWLMPRLGGFQALYPEIDVRIDATSKLADLSRYECDFAVRYGSGNWSDLPTDLISESLSFPVGAPGFTQSADGSMQPSEILACKLLHEDHGAVWTRWFAEAGMQSVRFPAAHELSTMLVIEAARVGQGIALLSEDLVSAYLESGELVKYSDVTLDYGGYYLVYQAGTTRRHAPKAFREWILAESAGLRSAADARG